MKKPLTQYSNLPAVRRKKNLKLKNRATYIFYKYLWNRTHRYNYNTGIALTGDTGVGKTKLAILGAYLLNPDRFNENFYANTAKEFLTAIDDSRKGDTIVFDEVGVSLSSRKWHSLSNILTAETLQTYRVNKLTVFFVVPDMSFIDVQARKLMTMYSELKRYDNSRVWAWNYRISVNRKDGKVYFPYYRFVMEGSLYKMPKYSIKRKMLKTVPKEIWDRTQEKEMVFKKTVRQKSLKEISLIEMENAPTKTIFDYINTVQKDTNIGKFKNTKGGWDTNLIQLHLKISRDKARQIKKFLEKV